MRKVILSGLSFFVCVLLMAQDDQDPEVNNSSNTFKIGVKGGLSLPSLSDNSDNVYTQDYESYASYEAGFFVERRLNNLLSLQVELNYTVKGGERKGLQPIPQNSLPAGFGSSLPPGQILYGRFDNKSALKYLEIPILAKVNFGKGNFKFFANAGPYVGYLVGAEQKTSGLTRIYGDPFGLFPITLPAPIGDSPLPFDAETDIQDDIKDFNVGIIAGVGVMKDLGTKSQLLFEVRGTYGFIPVQENSTFGKSNIGSVLFSLGYAYKL